MKLYQALVEDTAHDPRDEEVIVGSTVGVDWATTPAYNSTTTYICYGMGKFVGVVQDSSVGLYSTDGIIWTVSTLPAVRTYAAIATNNIDKYVVCMYKNSQWYVSYDGITWSIINTNVNQELRNIKYHNGQWQVLAASTSSAYNFPDAAILPTSFSLSVTTLPTSTYWQILAGGNNYFVAMSITTSQGAYRQATGSTSTSWTAFTLPTVSSGGLFYDGSRFITTLMGTNNLYVSGITPASWSTVITNISFYSAQDSALLTKCGDVYISIGYNTPQAYYTTDTSLRVWNSTSTPGNAVNMFGDKVLATSPTTVVCTVFSGAYFLVSKNILSSITFSPYWLQTNTQKLGTESYPLQDSSTLLPRNELRLRNAPNGDTLTYLNRADFPELWEWAKKFSKVYPDNTWRITPAQQIYYSAGDGSTTFGVPSALTSIRTV